MRKKLIDHFFKELDSEIQRRANVILLGASAGSLMGHIRPSIDIDFEIRLKEKGLDGERIDEAIRSVSRRIGVAVNYSENVSHWSMISFLDYRKTARPYKKFGKLSVNLIAPDYWTIGKMARYLQTDITDMIKIIRIHKLKPQRMIDLWARALHESELSLDLASFRDHVMHFINQYGKRAWGKNFQSDSAVQLFRKKSARK